MSVKRVMTWSGSADLFHCVDFRGGVILRVFFAACLCHWLYFVGIEALEVPSICVVLAGIGSTSVSISWEPHNNLVM